MITVDVDFNNIDGQGRVRTLPSHEFDSISIGDHVHAVDSLEDMEFDAVVADRCEDGSLILAMNWTKPTTREPALNWDFGRTSSAAMVSVSLHMPVPITFPRVPETSAATNHPVGAGS